MPNTCGFLPAVAMQIAIAAAAEIIIPIIAETVKIKRPFLILVILYSY